jgi:hypothetical protein
VCGSYQLLDERDERLQVLLDCEVELVAVLQIDGDCAVLVGCL